jgi:hypothetical protein
VLRKFIQTPSDDELIARVKEYANFSTYDTNLWGNVESMQNMALMREVPAMLQDPVINSCLASIMGIAFQTNEDQKVLWPVSDYEVITNELKAFHEEVNMSQQVITAGYNELLWGNLPYQHYFNDEGEFTNFTPIPDFTQVVPIILSGKTLGYIVQGEFRYPYEFSYGQLEYYKNLGGIYKNNFVQMSGGLDSGVAGGFANEFTVAPSYLSTAAKPWRNINIIEDALLLNRMDQSNYYRILSVTVNGAIHSKAAIRVLNYYRNLFQKVRRVSYDSAGMASRGGMQNFEVIVPKNEKQGVEVTNVGGEVEVRAIKDLETQYNKLFAALRVQPSEIGFGEQNTNAIGESNGASYYNSLARTSKPLVYSVLRLVRGWDRLYLRSRGYDVKDEDWKYGTVSLSILEDQDRAETLKQSIHNLTDLVTVLNSIQLQSYNKNYLVESVLGPALSSANVDVKKLLEPDANEPMMQDLNGQGQLLARWKKGAYNYKTAYLTSMVNTMEVSKTFDKGMIASFRETIKNSESSARFITSASVQADFIRYSAMDDIGYAVPDSTRVDLSGAVGFLQSSVKEVEADLGRLQTKKNTTGNLTIDTTASILIPNNLEITAKDINSASIRSLGKVFCDADNNLIITSKRDLCTYLHMKKSGLFSCVVREFVQLPPV